MKDKETEECLQKMAREIGSAMMTSMAMIYAMEMKGKTPEAGKAHEECKKRLEEILDRGIAEAKARIATGSGNNTEAHAICYTYVNVFRELANLLEDAADAQKVS